MPNRILKDSICQSEKIDALSPEAECLYYRFMVQCDDYGTYKADPRIIKSMCYPLKDGMTSAKIEKLLTELIDAGLIMPYEVSGKSYYYFLNWTRHQQIKNKRSKYPMPSDDDIEQYHSKIERCRSEKVRLCYLNPIQSESNPNPNPNTNRAAKASASPFTPPTLDEVVLYCTERNRGVNPRKWYDHYTANGWKVGKVKMVDWKSAVRTWEPDDAKKMSEAERVMQL